MAGKTNTVSLAEVAVYAEFPELGDVMPEDSVLCYALRKGQPLSKIITLVNLYACDPSEQEARAFYLAIVLGRADVVHWMLRGTYVPEGSACTIDPGAFDQRALRLARRCEHDAIIIRLLMCLTVDATIDDHELLVYACDRGNAALVSSLVTWRRWLTRDGPSQFVDPYANNALAIRMALKRGDVKCVNLVLFNWNHPRGHAMSPRASLKADMLQKIDSPLVRDQLHSMWQSVPPCGSLHVSSSPRATITRVSYYDDDDDDGGDDGCDRPQNTAITAMV